MRKKTLIISLSIPGFIILCILGFMGWFTYQMRNMSPLETSRISDSIFVIKGDMGNMYLIKNNTTYIAFDASDNPDKMAKGCKSLSIDPSSVSAVFLTHSDADHVNGLPAFSAAKVYLSQEEVPLLKEKKYRHFLGMSHMNKLPVSTYETLSDGDSVLIDGMVVHATSTPGHTLGSMCFRVGESLFTGDLCFILNDKVLPMLKIFTEDMQIDSASIQKIAGMPDVKRLYTAHTGYTMNLEKALENWR